MSRSFPKPLKDRTAAQHFVQEYGPINEARDRFFELLGEVRERKGAPPDARVGDVVTEEEGTELLKQAADEHSVSVEVLHRFIRTDYQEFEERMVEAARLRGFGEEEIQSLRSRPQTQ
jgi:hypothetical protein